MKPRASRKGAGSKRSGASSSKTPRRRAGTDASRPDATVVTELRALRLEMERAAGQVKEVVQKLERLTSVVGELREAVADLQAALGESEVEYGAVDESDSEMGEGHA